MELAKYKEVMTWNENTYTFVPNPKLLQTSTSSNGTSKNFICQKYILKIIKDCVKGLAYLHGEAGIIHRDIKPQNILLCSSKHLAIEEQDGVPFTAKFCDFGVSEKLEVPFD